jgi:hypothetical protein
VIGVNEFQIHQKLLAEQRRLQDLERRYQQAARVALREIWASDDDAENDEDWEVIEDGENEAAD